MGVQHRDELRVGACARQVEVRPIEDHRLHRLPEAHRRLEDPRVFGHGGGSRMDEGHLTQLERGPGSAPRAEEHRRKHPLRERACHLGRARVGKVAEVGPVSIRLEPEHSLGMVEMVEAEEPRETISDGGAREQCLAEHGWQRRAQAQLAHVQAEVGVTGSTNRVIEEAHQARMGDPPIGGEEILEGEPGRREDRARVEPVAQGGEHDGLDFADRHGIPAAHACLRGLWVQPESSITIRPSRGSPAYDPVSRKSSARRITGPSATTLPTRSPRLAFDIAARRGVSIIIFCPSTSSVGCSNEGTPGMDRSGASGTTTREPSSESTSACTSSK